jgi:hypothetical protein
MEAFIILIVLLIIILWSGLASLNTNHINSGSDSSDAIFYHPAVRE